VPSEYLLGEYPNDIRSINRSGDFFPCDHILNSSANCIFFWPWKSRNSLGTEHFEIQSEVPRSNMKIDARIPTISRTSEKPKPASWLAETRRSRVLFDRSIPSPLKDSRFLRYLGALLWHTSHEGSRPFVSDKSRVSLPTIAISFLDCLDIMPPRCPVQGGPPYIVHG